MLMKSLEVRPLKKYSLTWTEFIVAAAVVGLIEMEKKVQFTTNNVEVRKSRYYELIFWCRCQLLLVRRPNFDCDRKDDDRRLYTVML